MNRKLHVILGANLVWLTVLFLARGQSPGAPGTAKRPADSPNSVAMVVDVAGTVTAYTHGASGPAGRMQLLFPGDQLIIDKGGRAKLLIFTDKHLEVATAASVRLGKAGCEPRDHVQTILLPQLRGSEAIDALKSSSGRSAAGFLRGDLPLERAMPVLPSRQTVVVTDRPTFKWSPKTGASSYEFLLLRDGSPRVVWRQSTNKPEFEYPKNVPPLQRPASYRWSISWTDAGGKPHKFESKFSLATAEEAKELQQVAEWDSSHDAAKLLLAAIMYKTYGVNDKAVGALGELTKIVPDDPMVWESYAYLLNLVGRSDDASKATARAESLKAKK